MIDAYVFFFPNSKICDSPLSKDLKDSTFGIVSNESDRFSRFFYRSLYERFCSLRIQEHDDHYGGEIICEEGNYDFCG